MSTRGVVAVLNEDGKGWKGIYNHSDSYPTGLGADVWEQLQKHGVEAVSADLLKFAEWDDYLEGGVCPYCGKKAGAPHTFTMGIYGRGTTRTSNFAEGGSDAQYKTKKEMTDYYQSLSAWKGRDAEIKQMVDREFELRERVAKTGYPDVKAQYHKHSKPGKESIITSRDRDNAAPLFYEWIYVLDPKTGTMTILHHYDTRKTFIENGTTQSRYGWRLVTSLDAPRFTLEDRNAKRRMVFDYISKHPDVPLPMVMDAPELAGLNAENKRWILDDLERMGIIHHNYSSPGFEWGENHVGTGTTFSVSKTGRYNREKHDYDPPYRGDGPFPDERTPEWEKIQYAGKTIADLPDNMEKLDRANVEHMCPSCQKDYYKEKYSDTELDLKTARSLYAKRHPLDYSGVSRAMLKGV